MRHERDLKALAKQLGWTMWRRGKRHEIWRCRYGCCQTSLCGSSGDWRAQHIKGAELRRCPGALAEAAGLPPVQSAAS